MRIRQVKPEFYKHVGLGELSRDIRYLFKGIWHMADRNGILLDAPKLIKAEIFPYDEDVTASVINDWLQQLADQAEGFILRYETNGKKYILIQNFEKHQRFDSRERAKNYPGPTCAEYFRDENVCDDEHAGNTQQAVPDIWSNGDTDIRSNGVVGSVEAPPPPILKRSIELAQGYARNSPNHQETHWVEAYLRDFYVLNRTEWVNLTDDDMYFCWSQACETWDKGSAYVRRVFRSKLSEFDPSKRPKQYASKPVALTHSERLMAAKRIKHSFEDAEYLTSELRMDEFKQIWHGDQRIIEENFKPMEDIQDDG